MKLVMNLRTTINNRIQVEFAASGINKRKVIQRIVYEELVNHAVPRGRAAVQARQGKE